MIEPSQRIIVCNNASLPPDLSRGNNVRTLSYDPKDEKKNINIGLPMFVDQLMHIPDRLKDLLEIASYIFLADRLERRGARDDIEYHQWGRHFCFVIKVRDFEFWEKPSVRDKLNQTLCFMTGDKAYKFVFQPGHNTEIESLFDKQQVIIPELNSDVILFSGGLDSTAGIVQMLESTRNNLCLISHQSGAPSMTSIQNALFQILCVIYPNRLKHFKFKCSLKQDRNKAAEETQRSRAFLYNSIAFTLSQSIGKTEWYVFENGVTTLNFPKRQDMINARASRTTHPKTISLLQELFSMINENKVKIITPFFWSTKADIISVFKTYNQQDLISKTISCSQTFQNLGSTDQCGGCPQCIDRRFAAYASELEQYDNTYSLDIITDSIEQAEVKTAVIDHLRLASRFDQWNIDHFYAQMISQLIDIIDHIDCRDEFEAVSNIFSLCKRHGSQVLKAINRIRTQYDNPFTELAPNCLLTMLAERKHLKDPVMGLVDSICLRLKVAIPIAFQKNGPKNENDFNDKVSALLSSYKEELSREHPSVKFAHAIVKPDHAIENHDLFIESKYLRGSTTPSKITDGIAADMIKYPPTIHKLFVVYDKEHSITNDAVFCDSFESKGKCTICIIR